MKFNEKMNQCRKRLGLSQEELAQRIGVSRQSISKWETGEAFPEITKLPLLAKEFDVTIDWLLSDEDDNVKEEINEMPASTITFPSWIDKLPSHMLSLIKRFGWLYGVYLAIGGAVFSAVGFLARAMFKTLIFDNSSQMDIFFPQMHSSFDMQGWKMISMFTGFIIGLGVIITICGILLAIFLKIWGSKKAN